MVILGNSQWFLNKSEIESLRIAENQFQNYSRIIENHWESSSDLFENHQESLRITKNQWKSVSELFENHRESLRINFRLIRESSRITENCQESLRINDCIYSDSHWFCESFLFSHSVKSTGIDHLAVLADSNEGRKERHQYIFFSIVSHKKCSLLVVNCFKLKPQWNMGWVFVAKADD